MRRGFQIVALLSMLAAGTVAGRALDAGKVEAVKNATAAFVALAKDSHKTGLPPRLSDPVAKPLLDTVLVTTELNRGRVPWSQLLTLNDWNLSVIKVGLVYLLAGTGAEDLAALDKIPGAHGRVDRNTATYAPELGRYFDAQLRIQGAIIDTVQEFLKTAKPEQTDKPQFKTGIGQIRSGVTQTISGVLGCFAIEGISDDWRRARLTQINAIAPRTVKFLPSDDKRSLAATARQIEGQMKDAKVKDGLNAFAKIVEAR